MRDTSVGLSSITRMHLGRSVGMRRTLGCWQRETETRPVAGGGFDPNSATKALDDSFTGRKSNSGAGDVRSVEAFEWDKYLVLVLLLDADPIVANGKNLKANFSPSRY